MFGGILLICPDCEIEMEEVSKFHSPTSSHIHFVCPKCKLEFCKYYDTWWGYQPKKKPEKDFREEAQKLEPKMNNFEYLWDDGEILGGFYFTCVICGHESTKEDTYDLERPRTLTCEKCGAKYKVYKKIWLSKVDE